MLKRLKKNKAVVMLEYVAVTMFILTALYVFRDYIVRAFMGRLMIAADTFGKGRQYDPRQLDPGDPASFGTIECFFDYNHCRFNAWDAATLTCPVGQKLNTWIDQRCSDRYCDCTLPEDHPDYVGLGFGDAGGPKGCLKCLFECQRDYCLAS